MPEDFTYLYYSTNPEMVLSGLAYLYCKSCTTLYTRNQPIR